MIESTQNDKIKYLTKISTDNRFRKKERVFLVEGKQENTSAVAFGFEVLEFFIAPDIFTETVPEGKVHLISSKIYNKIAYRENAEGIIAVYKMKENLLSELEVNENSTLIVVEGVEKPGNLGAILRSCEAFGILAVIVTDAKVDFYNPNVIRSSVGCVFGMALYQATNEETFRFLEDKGISVFTTMMGADSSNIQTKNLNQKAALVFGTEHSGLSAFWQNKGENVLIPMAGTIDSLNLSNAVAISCYEALRQKMA